MAATKDEPPRNVRWEIAHLSQVNSIRTESINYSLDPKDRALISFEIETDILLDPLDREIEILDIEPIVFRYPAPKHVGSLAPEILSDRSDFPRDLLHLFPTPADEPASLCLARSGLQPIYNSSGVMGVVSRLLNWLSDAKTETLYEDGWDPVPPQTGTIRVFGYIDCEALQHHAHDHPDGGFRFIGAGITHWPNEKVFVEAAGPFIDPDDVSQLNSAKERMRWSKKPGTSVHTVIPAIFLWPPGNRIEDKPSFTTWRDMASFKDGLRNTGLYDTLEEAFLFVDGYFDPHADGGKLPEADTKGNRALMVILGLWRPVPLDPTIVGLAAEEGPRCLELRAFYLQRPIYDKNRWSEDTSFFEFFGLVSNDARTLQDVSGATAFGMTTLLGAGALGSAFADYALRGGTDRLTVVDKDCLLPHNIARHRGDGRHVGKRKTDVVDNLAATRVQGAKIKKYNEDIFALDDACLADRFSGVDQVIDTTANPLVRRRLSFLKGVDLPVMRTEIFHRGRLGISLLTKLGSTQNLNFLFHQSVVLAMQKKNKSVQAWLAYENSRTYKDEELLLGFGCHSMTTRLPAYAVDAHASSAFALANARLRSLDQPLIALHQIDEEGMSLGTEVIPAEPVRAFNDPRTNEWRIIVAENVLEALQQMRRSAAPDETGGYLFGAIDESASEIYVLAASPEPPGTLGSPTGLQLGRWGLTGFEKTFLRRTCNRLPPIGTWHSHPTGDVRASKKDWATIRVFKVEDARRGLPTVMAITALTDDAFYVQG